ncbi:hypothetical protein BC835DRAFT_1304528 [Cytidiella melzeri]|nr:hypothetical protein BC835DRAFT_1304528 [Cytidiella melzeri]
MDIPAKTPTAWLQLQRIIRSLKYTAFHNGIGVKWDLDIACTGCGGMDHWRGLCPFRAIPGWNGSLMKSEIPADNACTDEQWDSHPPPNSHDNQTSQKGRRGNNTSYRARGSCEGGGRGRGGRGRGGRGGRTPSFDDTTSQ